MPEISSIFPKSSDNATTLIFAKMKRERINVDLGNIIPVSTVDWHNRSSCVVFFNKCPLKCKYCQNYKLLDDTNIVDIHIVKRKIEDSMNFVSTVVFSGGEPTLQEKALGMLLRFSKRNELLTGIQTSGYYPNVLKRLIDYNLLDKIFLDIKASPSNADNYKEITGADDARRKVIESFDIINMSSVKSEIRTTVFKSFIDEVYDIARFLEKSDYRGTYVLQTGVPGNAPTEEIRKEKPIKNAEMVNITKRIANDIGINIKYK